MIPWKSRKPWVWDATCKDTLVPIISSHHDIATSGAGKFAAMAEEEKKEAKYFHVDLVYALTPLAIKSLGVISFKSLKFVINIGLRIRQMTENVLHALFILSLYVAVLRGNADKFLALCVCVCGGRE